jgi:hypothetical protein
MKRRGIVLLLEVCELIVGHGAVAGPKINRTVREVLDSPAGTESVGN